MIASVAGALVAGVLTTLAPCAVSLLPIIVGGSVQGAADSDARRRVFVIAASLGVSVFAFTLLLKASTALIGVSPSVWQWISGGVLITLGVVSVFPQVWDRVSVSSGLNAGSNTALKQAHDRTDWAGPVLIGAALGPVFTSCSPLFGYVVVTVLPADLTEGLILLTAYVVGLVAVLLLIGLAGQSVVRRLRWAVDPHSWFRRGLGVLFIVVGVLIATGWMKDIETWLLINSPVAPWEWGSDWGLP